MGHGYARSQEPYQSDADGESRKEDHCQRGTEASMDLCKFFFAMNNFFQIYIIRLYNLESNLYIYHIRLLARLNIERLRSFSWENV